MKRLRRLSIWPLLAAALLPGCGSSPQPAARQAAPPQAAARAPAILYPETRRGDVVDVHHGVRVPDPYRWLEDPDSEETRAWIAAQNRVTSAHLDTLPGRAAIRERLTRLWDHDSHGVPEKVAGRYFFTRREGLQNQAVLYWTPSLDAEPRVLLDPNRLSEDGTVSLARREISRDGKYLAYGLQEAGSDWMVWRVREVATGEDLDDVVRWSKFDSVAWSHAGDGFYYGRYPAPEDGARLTGVNMGQALYFHRLGTPQSEDALVYERPDEPRWSYEGQVTEDGRYLIISVSKGTGPKNLVLYQDLSAPAAPGQGVVTLVGAFEAKLRFIDSDGPRLWFLTDLDAPRGRLIAIDLRQPERAHWQEVVPQAEATLQEVHLVGERFLAEYLEDAHSKVVTFDLDGTRRGEVTLPGIGSAHGFTGRRGDRETFYGFTSFTTPPTIYRHDLDSGASEVLRKPAIDFDSSRYHIEQVFYQSKDGTRVPMFLTHARDLARDGNSPTLLYGYGGFNVSVTPSFSVTRAMWLEMGGVLAIPNLRGGGEYGEEWHRAGTKLHKQNVFDDFIAAAEWLIESGYTSPDRLAIRGRSNGGLLVGAAMTQRPDLFAVALPAVGVMDMLRFHEFTIGWAWVDDYGSAEDPEQFRALHAYSPYHNLAPATYPATLVTTADHDDRVVPGHSFKFTAALQAAHQGDAPVLIRIETRAGHGAGKPTTMRIAEDTDILAFTAARLGMSYPAAP